MSPVESWAVAACAAAALATLIAGRRRIPRWAIVVAAVPVGGALATIVVASYRWQLLVLLIAAGVSATSWVVRVAHRRAMANWLAVLALTLTACAAFAIWALPVTALPRPAGPYSVGVVDYAAIDANRIELWGPSAGGPRQVSGTVWYPAATTSGSTANGHGDRWLSDARVPPAIARSFGLPAALSTHLNQIEGVATHGAAIAENGPFPVVLFSHGWSGFSELHSHQFASLASHGYLVIAINHPYAALVARLADESIATLDAAALPNDADAETYAAAARRLVMTLAADVEFAFTAAPDQLPPSVAAAMDPARVAIMGHSTGGGAALIACARNRWCDAVVGYDPWVEPVPDDVIGAGLDVPLLSIRSQEWTALPNDRRLRRLHAGSTAAKARVEILASTHRDFTLVPLLSPLSRWSDGPGSATTDDPRDTLRIVDVWTTRFLDRHLRGRGLDPTRFPPHEPRAIPETDAAANG